MPEYQVQSVAVFDVLEGKEQECLEVLRALYGRLQQKNYSRDLLFRDSKQPQRMINVRFWRSEQARKDAAEDPDIHRYWLRLPELLHMLEVYERLEGVPGFASRKEDLF